MSPILDKLRTERDQVRSAAIAIAEGENFDPADDNFHELETRAAELDKRIESMANLLNQQAAADALDGRMAKMAKQVEEDRQQRSANTGGQQTRESWGTTFTRSSVFKDYRQRGQSPVLEVEALETRALPTGIGSLVDAGFDLGKLTYNIQPPAIPTPLLNNVSTVTVSGNAIEYVSWKVISGEADIVPEGQPKPPIEYGPTVTPDTLDMIAGYTQLTRQLIEDASAVRNYIDDDLRRQVLIKEEKEAASVIGAASLPTASGDDLLSAIRVAIGDVQAAGYNPSAVLMNPADYADLDIAVMAATVSGPTVGQRFWGLTPIPSTAQPAGEAIVGDFATGVVHFVRSAVGLYITDSHGETFLSNVFTLLAERRAKTAVVRPDALAVASAGSGS